jgi:phosphinothricin acetyltransferase
VSVRPATVDDLPAITAIYAHHVLHGTGTFETVPPDVAEMTRRFDEVRDRGLPWLVDDDGGVRGYAYANWFRPRLAYRYFVEDSVYVAPEAVGRGIGRALLEALVDAATEAGARQMLAVIGDAENAASIGVHAALGFERTGVLRASGWKLGRWLDVVLMQRALGDGDGRAPG